MKTPGSFALTLGDCLDGLCGLRSLAADSVDALVTDPPAGIGFMGKEWDGDKGGRSGWVAWMTSAMRECLRALKPGAHALVWALPRTSHWTATAIEDAGFEIRDVITHHFGSGFPKSLDVSKAIDSRAAASREIVGRDPNHRERAHTDAVYEGGQTRPEFLTAPSTDAAKQWAGWGTALKPGTEHWILARKPLTGTVAQNVLEYSTGALHVDACRIAGTPESPGSTPPTANGNRQTHGKMVRSEYSVPTGRWPANVLLSHSASCEDGPCVEDCPVREMDAFAGKRDEAGRPGDKGGASRFFYCAKPSTAEREAGLLHLPRMSGADMVDREEGTAALSSPRAGAGRGSAGRANFHPTVKSIALMTWLLKLVMPPRGIVIDPFAGSGTTGVAAYRLGHRFVGWEKDPDYHALAMARIKAARGQLELCA